jgi:hypothetical protein
MDCNRGERSTSAATRPWLGSKSRKDVAIALAAAGKHARRQPVFIQLRRVGYTGGVREGPAGGTFRAHEKPRYSCAGLGRASSEGR